jgi:hypothetical protein
MECRGEQPTGQSLHGTGERRVVIAGFGKGGAAAEDVGAEFGDLRLREVRSLVTGGC